MLDPTELRLYRSDSEIVRFAQAEGYLQVVDNHALLLVEEARRPGDARRRRAARAAAARPSPSSRRPARTPSGAASPSATSAAGRRSCGSPSRAELTELGRVRRHADERVLAERLIGYETSRPEELVAAAGFVKGWLESRDIEVVEHDHNGLPVLVAEVGARRADAPCVVFHGHLDVVPGRPEQFQPRVEGDRLIGRGAYDMKGGLAAMMCALRDVAEQDRVRVRFVCVPDEESEELDERSTDAVVAARARRRLRDHRRADRHAHRRRGQGRAGDADRRPRARRAQLDAVARRQRRAQGDRRVPRDRDAAVQPRVLGDVRPPVDQPRADRRAATRSTRSPTAARWPSTSATCPARTPGRSSRRCAPIPEIEVERTFIHPPRRRLPAQSLRAGAARGRRALDARRGDVSVGRDGASDAASFIEAGIPAVEFGPAGGGHHGPDEWVSLSSLARYRRALADFVRALPELAGAVASRGRRRTGAGLTAIEGGLA